MTTKIFYDEQIRHQVLKVLSGYCFRERRPDFPEVCILSPWISNVQLDIDKETYELDELFFGLDYGIHSVNLPYALLLLKLDFGANITLVTLPPTERNYHERAHSAKLLLDFLDEVGCSISVNPDLHSKLILTNDLCLVGSFNLSIAALYDREEIGISIDDMENLEVLDNYVRKVRGSSKHYGVASPSVDEIVTGKVTRGWLYEDIVRKFYEDLGTPMRRSYSSHTFLNGFFGTIYTSDVMEMVSSDLDGFYLKAILGYLESEAHSDEQRLTYLKRRFGYNGRHEIHEIFEFLESKLARAHVPKIPPIAEILPKSRRRLSRA